MDDIEDLDPLGLGPVRKPEPPKEPEVPAPVDDSIFAPQLPIPAPTQQMIPAEHSDSVLGHASLAAKNVSEQQRLVLPTINMPASTTQEQQDLVDRSVTDIVLYGAKAAAMVCRGEGEVAPNGEWARKPCPYLEKCPFYQAKVDITPWVSKECPFELSAMTAWVQGYMRELGVNPHDVTNIWDSQTATIMAGLQLQMHRARWGEAINPLLEQELKSITPQGIINIIKIGNFNTEAKERAIKAIEKYARTNMQTRERKVALMKSGFKDKSKHAAEVAARMKALKEVERTVELSPEGDIKSLSEITRFTGDQEGKLNPDD